MINASLNNLPSELKTKLLSDADWTACKALATINKKWNHLFLQILQKDLYVQEVKEHIHKFSTRPSFVDNLLTTTTIESINKLSCWILANDILTIRYFLANKIKQTFQLILTKNEPECEELKKYAQIICADNQFASSLAVEPSTLSSLDEFCSHAQDLKENDPLKIYLTIMAPHIKHLDIRHLHLASTPQELDLLSSLNSLACNPISLKIKFL